MVMNVTGSGSYPVTGFDISTVESLGSVRYVNIQRVVTVTRIPILGSDLKMGIKHLFFYSHKSVSLLT
jgi:hypothetical protein